MRTNAKKKKIIHIPEYLIVLVSLLNLAVFVFSTDAFLNDRLFSLSSRALIIVNVCLLLYTVIMCIRRPKLFAVLEKKLLLFIILALYVFLAAIISPTDSTTESLTLVMGFLAVPIYMLCLPNLIHGSFLKNWLSVMALIYALFFLYMGFFKASYQKETEALLLGYSNSNRTGAYMLLVFVLFVLLSAHLKNMVLKILSIIIELLLIYATVLTLCRTAVILEAACFIYSLLPVAPRIGKKFSAFCYLFPAVFLWGYVIMYRRGLLGNAMLLGKPIFSGRQELFVSETAKLSVFGHFSSGIFAGLNYVQSVMNTLGIAGLVLYWLFLGAFFSSSFSDVGAKGGKKNIARFSMGIIMLHGCAETCFFTGGSVYAGMIACIICAISVINSQSVIESVSVKKEKRAVKRKANTNTPATR